MTYCVTGINSMKDIVMILLFPTSDACSVFQAYLLFLQSNENGMCSVMLDIGARF